VSDVDEYAHTLVAHLVVVRRKEERETEENNKTGRKSPGKQ
jgi:hypothetical protein